MADDDAAPSRFFIAVHVGLGAVSSSNSHDCEHAMSSACALGARVLEGGGPSEAAATEAIRYLEVCIHLMLSAGHRVSRTQAFGRRCRFCYSVLFACLALTPAAHWPAQCALREV